MLTNKATHIFRLMSLTMLAGIFFAAGAAAQSTGYFNEQVIVLNMSEYQIIQQTLQQEAIANRTELQQEAQSLQEELAEYRTQQSLLSEEARAAREQELVQLQRNLQETRMQTQQELVQREQQLLEPLFLEIQGALEQVAQDNNIDMILRIETLSYIDEDEIINVTPLVASEMGIDVSAGANAGPGASN